MFSWFTKDPVVHNNDEIYRRIERLDTAIHSLGVDIRFIKNHLENIAVNIQESVKLQMQDIQGRYIRSLEDKLIRFDTEVTALKTERDVERARMHSFYFNS